MDFMRKLIELIVNGELYLKIQLLNFKIKNILCHKLMET
jgi:hypothetical protein